MAENSKCDEQSDANQDFKSMEDIINAIGRGKWTYFLIAISCSYPAGEVVSLIGSEFQVPPLSFRCQDGVQLNESVPPVYGTECDVTDTNETEALPCTQFIYDTSVYITSLTSEFDLVCHRDFLRGMFKSLYLYGCIFGCVLGGPASDRFGRKPVIFYTTLILAVLNVLLIVIPNIYVILVIRFLMGTSFMVVAAAAYTIAIEACPTYMRPFFGASGAVAFAVMIMGSSAIAYFLRTWRQTQMAASFSLFIALIFTNPIFLKESPRWLMERGRLEEAHVEIKRAAKLNKTEHKLPSNLMDTLTRLHNTQKQDANETTEESFRERMLSLVVPVPMRKLTLVVWTLRFCPNCIYISIPYRANLFKSPFFYMGVLGFVEMVSYIGVVPFVMKFPRKLILSICFSVISALLLTLGILEVLQIDHTWVNMVLSSFTYMLASSAFVVNSVMGAELFPTSVRSTGISFARVFGNLGLTFPVFLTMILPVHLSWVSQFFMASLAATCVGLLTMLPESKGRPLLQTVQEYVQLHQRNSNKKCEINMDIVS